MNLSSDESRALAFIALVVALAAAARVAGRSGQLEGTADPLDAARLAAASDSMLRAAGRRPDRLGPGQRLDPNVAPAEELARLPRVSRALAERIVAERQRGGPFRAVSDLERVPGIGPRTAERLAPFLKLPAPTAPAPAEPRLHPGSVLIEPGTGVAGRPAGAAPRPPAPLDVNRATAAELERLPGIGPTLAARIVAYRDSAGDFGSADELLRIRGIGPALLARLRPHIVARP
ncbi:MAG TPA: helix-hairpin-helix domain-containing protein [Longimicrobiales bacterium]